MGLLQRYDGRFYAQIKDRSGKWVKRSLNTKDRTVAKAKYRELERAEADPTYRLANETTFRSACDDFIASRRRKGNAPDTIAFYEKKTNNLCTIIGDETPLSAVDANLVDKFIDDRLRLGGARRSIGMELGALRGVLKVARRAGKFLTGVDTVMPTDWSDEYKPEERALTEDEAHRLIKELAAPVAKKDRWGNVRTNMGVERNALNQAAAVAYMIATGCRLGEMRRAERRHVDLEKGFVFVISTKTRKSGKGDRYVPVTSLTRPLLEQVMAATAGRTTGKLFAPWGNISRDVGLACKRIGIPHCTNNDLRRTHGTWLRAAGVEPNLVGASLGHMDSRMVERVYGRLSPEALQALLLERTGTSKGQGSHKKSK